MTDVHHTLDGIVPMARPAFDRLLAQAESWGFSPVIGDALRTCADQAASTTSKVQRSWHLLGRAVDLQLSGADAYARLGAFWESMGGTWGGRWTTLYPPDGDFQHFQWSDGHDGIPQTVWPAGVPCEQARSAYLAPASTHRRFRAAVVGGVLGAIGAVGLAAIASRGSHHA